MQAKRRDLGYRYGVLNHETGRLLLGHQENNFQFRFAALSQLSKDQHEGTGPQPRFEIAFQARQDVSQTQDRAHDGSFDTYAQDCRGE